MKNIAISRFVKLISSLSLELKLEIMSKLTENIKASFNSKKIIKENLLEELSGSWSDTDEELANDIIESRTSFGRSVSLD